MGDTPEREEGPGRVLADDSDVLRGGAVLRTEVTASDEGDLHRVEVSVADDVVLSRRGRD